MTRDQVLEAIRSSIAFARDHFDDVEFSAEDAIRTERDFLAEALSLAAAEGATTLNVPDTVGYTTPEEITDLFRFLDRSVDRSDGVIFSTHCHDDLGMAVANSLAAVRGGARQIECAVNGIGERAGNCALEDVVMALRTREDFYQLGTNVDFHPDHGRQPDLGANHATPRRRATRRSSAPMRLRTKRAFTSTACCRTALPTKS